MNAVRLLLAAAAAVVGLALGLSPGPVTAHEGKAVIAMEDQAVEGTSSEVTVRVTWASDGHAAVDATVTAVVLAADGSPGTPVALAPLDDDGRYRGTVEFPGPGTWTVRFTSIDPTGALEARLPASPPVTSTTPTSGTTSTAPPTSAEGTAPTTSDEAAAPVGSSGDDNRGVLVASGIVAVLAVLAGGLAFRRIQQRDQQRTQQGDQRR